MRASQDRDRADSITPDEVSQSPASAIAKEATLKQKLKKKFAYDSSYFPTPFARAYMLCAPDHPGWDYDTKTVMAWTENELRAEMTVYEEDRSVDKDWLEDVKACAGRYRRTQASLGCRISR